MKPLEVGEIGIMVYGEIGDVGSFVEVTGIGGTFIFNGAYYEGKIIGKRSSHFTGEWSFFKDQLKRITDPDQEQTTEHDEVVEA